MQEVLVWWRGEQQIYFVHDPLDAVSLKVFVIDHTEAEVTFSFDVNGVTFLRFMEAHYGKETEQNK